MSDSTSKELAGSEPERGSCPSIPRDAFSKPMSLKPKAPPLELIPSLPTNSHRSKEPLWRDALGAYIDKPEKYGPSQVIYFDDDFVIVNDLFPKSSVHTLLLPRSAKFSKLHPFDAFEDAEFLASVRPQVTKLKQLVTKELQRRYGPSSRQDAAREAVFTGRVELQDGEDLPAGRDWSRDVVAGIHAHPSMKHLHIHVLSVDRFSEKMKHKKHYNSFATPFFIPIEDFPLSQHDVRRHPGAQGYLSRELKCWRCGKNFGQKFSSLKKHLAIEFEEWKSE